jgi:hypothetical protein
VKNSSTKQNLLCKTNPISERQNVHNLLQKKDLQGIDCLCRRQKQTQSKPISKHRPELFKISLAP